MSAASLWLSAGPVAALDEPGRPVGAVPIEICDSSTALCARPTPSQARWPQLQASAVGVSSSTFSQ